MTPVVYTKPGCPACVGTKRKFDQLGVAYDVVDISEDHDARDYLLTQGFKEMPVVVTARGSWTGYRPDRIKDYVVA